MIPNVSETVEIIFFALAVVIQVASSAGREEKYGTRCESLDAHWNPTPGQCVHFLICPRLLEFAKRPGKSTNDFRVLRKLTCGFRRDTPKICCPNEDIYHPPKREDDRSLGNINVPVYFPAEEHEPEDYDDEPVISPEIAISQLEEMTDYRDWNVSSISTYMHTIKSPANKGLIPRLEDCGDPKLDISTSTRIIGGSKAEPGQFPYMALLFRIDTETDVEEHFCAGTVINQFYILTAAHCIKTNDNTPDLLAFIQVGITDITERCQHNEQRECLHDRRYEVKETVVHPKYVYGSSDRSHDIALVRTKKPIELGGKYIRPVCLPYPKYFGDSDEKASQFRSEEATIGMAAGWGREFNSGPQSSTHLKSAILPILTRNDCQRRYETQVKITETQLCAGGEIGRDSCIGDSGGPLLVPYESPGRFYGKMFQTGIISFGPAQCGKSGKPSVYTKVASYIDWILENMYI